MKLIGTNIHDLWILESEIFRDDRGEFSRLFCEREFQNILAGRVIKQINNSITHLVGTVRGMHYQNAPHAEMKIIRCLKGRAFDVAIDLRQGSPTFMKWNAVELCPEHPVAYVIPEGFAHGFQVLEKDTQLLYFHTEFYNPESEVGIRFDDPKIGVAWPLSPSNISKRDSNHPYLNESFKGIVL